MNFIRRRVHDAGGCPPDPDPKYGAAEVTVTDVTDDDLAGFRCLDVYDGGGERAVVYLSPDDCAAIAAALLAGTPHGRGDVTSSPIEQAGT